MFLEELILGFGDRDCLEEADGEGTHCGWLELGKAPVNCIDEVEMWHGCFGVPLVEAVLDDVSCGEVLLCSHDAESSGCKDFAASLFIGLKNADQFEPLGFQDLEGREWSAPEADGCV